MIQQASNARGDRGRSILLPDTHAHLDAPELRGDIDAVIGRAIEAGVERILAVGMDLESSRATVEMARRFPVVYAAVGVHPHRAAQFDREADAVEALLDEEKVVAVGEIGLDLYRERAPKEVQLAAFRAQLEWAEDRKLPVSVHNRNAGTDTLRMLEATSLTAVLHCFGTDAALADVALRSGCYLSFAGNVTFPKATDLRQVAVRVPEDRLLVETDAPVLAPQGHRGRTNEPSYVVETARTLAAARGESMERLAASVTRNANAVFAWDTA